MKTLKKKNGKKVLGRGLSALISTQTVPVQEKAGASPSEPRLRTVTGGKALPSSDASGDLDVVQYVPINQIAVNPFQPRKDFPEADLQELAASIKAHGVLQPPLVRPPHSNAEHRFEIVAGERRWRAAKLAGLTQLPVIIKELGDKESLEMALVENVQRADLNPVEEAHAYQALAEEFPLNQQQIAERVGKDRTSVANCMRLLKLPPEVVELVRTSKLSFGHAKAILTVREPAAQISLAKRCLAEGLSVRAVEDIVARVVVIDGPKNAPSKKRPNGEAPFPSEFLDKLRNSLGTKVVVRHHNSGRGRIEIEYFSEQELERLIDHICR